MYVTDSLFYDNINFIPEGTRIICNYDEEDVDLSNYIDIINDYFPEAKLKEQLEKIKKEDSNHKLVSDKFNGEIVMNITNLKNKELGKFIYDFKKYVENKFSYEIKKTPGPLKKTGDTSPQCAHGLSNKTGKVSLS